METKYSIHSQYVRLLNAEKEVLNNLKTKSTPLIINDSLVPPINSERIDLPWNLGSKSHPWKNLYISNKKNSQLSTDRSEVLDVYTSIVSCLDSLNQKQDKLPTTTTPGKILKSTSTSGIVEWGDSVSGSVIAILGDEE